LATASVFGLGVLVGAAIGLPWYLESRSVASASSVTPSEQQAPVSLGWPKKAVPAEGAPGSGAKPGLSDFSVAPPASEVLTASATDRYTGAFSYDPTNGTTSEGDVYRVNPGYPKRSSGSELADRGGLAQLEHKQPQDKSAAAIRATPRPPAPASAVSAPASAPANGVSGGAARNHALFAQVTPAAPRVAGYVGRMSNGPSKPKAAGEALLFDAGAEQPRRTPVARATQGVPTVVPSDRNNSPVADNYFVYYSAMDLGDYELGKSLPSARERLARQQSLRLGIYDQISSLGRDVDGDRDLLVVSHPDQWGWFESESAATAEAYEYTPEGPFLEALGNPLSTFSIDVDTASYANVRRFLNQGQLPPPDAVRIEEMVNYFSYDYPTPSALQGAPTGDAPFSVNVEIADCPWSMGRRLARIGLRGREIAPASRPACNLVFLIDVSGSMKRANKLPLVKESLRMLTANLDAADRVAIVVYAGASGLVLESTPCADTRPILDALDQLQAGGSTNGGAGIELAYQTAAENFIEGGVNRVVLATDGDFNVGVANRGDLIRLIEQKAKDKIFLTVLGFGMGNLKDSTLEALADKGNGNYAYIDTINEARKALVDELNATLVTIAKDVKIQVEFNPAQVAAYRLIGYENRMLRAEDFNDDTKDAGEIGAGHRVTAFYEIVPAGKAVPGVDGATTLTPPVDALRYQAPARLTQAASSREMFTVKLRYKPPEGDTSRLIEVPASDAGLDLDAASGEYLFATAVASFGMILRDSNYRDAASIQSVLDLARAGKGADAFGYRAEFIGLVEKAQTLLVPAVENSEEGPAEEQPLDQSTQ
jgi:Ca-activated chloride channel family protein